MRARNHTTVFVARNMTRNNTDRAAVKLTEKKIKLLEVDGAPGQVEGAPVSHSWRRKCSQITLVASPPARSIEQSVVEFVRGFS